MDRACRDGCEVGGWMGPEETADLRGQAEPVKEEVLGNWLGPECLTSQAGPEKERLQE